MGRHDGVPDVLLDARTRRGGAGLWEIHGGADAASRPGHPADRCPHHAGIGGSRRQLHNAWLLFSHRLIRIDHHPSGIRPRTDRAQRPIYTSSVKSITGILRYRPAGFINFTLGNRIEVVEILEILPKS